MEPAQASRKVPPKETPRDGSKCFALLAQEPTLQLASYCSRVSFPSPPSPDPRSKFAEAAELPDLE